MAFRLPRFIPAGAGNTVSTIFDMRAAPVYPRWRGEHQRIVGNFKHGTGLSPLARGTPPDNLRVLSCHRFIPAGAGNTWLS
ncbi:hypothetical protein AW67_34350 [Salmonella enterica subsp. enterica serovar Montevideo str. USDA-ARS-USMARC-1903]|nr:hypothetical protein AW67_34350 [Salmonella enterica subsp. enterica serovar Montevideo str. USDA-ARS-USMARC-1903]